MIIEDIKYKLKDGREITLRSPKEEDIESIIEYLIVTAGETDFLMNYPEEWEKRLTVEGEKELIDRYNSSLNDVMIVCDYNGKIIGNCSLNRYRSLKTRHRASLGIAIIKEFWGQGIGSRLFDELIKISKGLEGLTQLELDYIEGNERGASLYKKKGFEVVSYKPNAIRLKDGTLLKEYSMIKEL